MDIDLNNIFLVGLPGSGKTTIGKILAKKLSKGFYDSDQFLVERTGVSVKTIFEIEGELGFRKRESNIIAELSQKNNIVLATGGGSILNSNNRQLLKQNGFIVYLEANPKLLYTRTYRDNTRPLLQNANLLDKLDLLYQERVPLYQEIADLIFPVEKTSLYHCADKIISLIHARKRL